MIVSLLDFVSLPLALGLVLGVTQKEPLSSELLNCDKVRLVPLVIRLLKALTRDHCISSAAFNSISIIGNVVCGIHPWQQQHNCLLF